MKKFIGASLLIFALILPTGIFAQAPQPKPPVLTVKAAGAAIYGWHDGVPTLLYQKKQNWLYPIASITKLTTANAVEQLFSSDKMFTVSATAVKTEGGAPGVTVGAVLSRDDLLRALLISSSNDAATVFAEYATKLTLVATMNTFLHDNHYTSTNFVNPSGLDPVSKSIAPNRMTAYNISRLISDIYTHDSVLRDIMTQKTATITDQKTGVQSVLKSSDELNYDPLYADRVLIGKTGRTNKAAETLTFVTDGYGDYDYITVVLLYTGYRYQDGKAVLDWLEKMKEWSRS